MAVKREKVTRTAEKLVGKGKIEGAIKEYRKILAENPNDANVLNRVGDLYARIERFDEAIKLFSQIAEQYTGDGFFLKAIAIYKKIIKLAPASLQVYERLAELYHRQGLLNEARSQFQILADHYEKRDNATSAITIYQRMAEIDPDNPSNYVRLAELYQKQRLHDKARQAYRQLADLLLVAGSVDEATQVYLKALDHYHEELEFVGEVVRGLRDEGHAAAAQQVLEKARQLNPAATEERLGLAPPVEEAPVEAPPEPAEEPVHEIEAPAAEEGDFGGFGDEEDDDDSVFTLDLDDDGPAASQVLPPSDLEEPTAAEPTAAEPTAAEPTAAEPTAAEPTAAEPSPFDAAAEAAAEASKAFGEPAATEEGEELDWSMDEFDDLEGGDLAEAAPVELEGDELEFELEIEPPIELEGKDVPVEGTPAAAAPATPAAVEESVEEAEPEAMARREEDLLAEAQVFAKYNLREKAEDRLLELLGMRADHLGGLCLMARLDLEAGRRDEAVERAKAAAEAAGRSGDVETFEKLREDLAAAGLELGEDLVVRATEAAEQKPFAQLLEDLDETSTAVPEDLEVPEGFELEPTEAAGTPAAGTPVAETPAAETPAPPPPAEEEIAKPQTVAPDSIHATTAFTLGPLEDEDEDEEPAEVEVEPAAQTRPFKRVKSEDTQTVDLPEEPAAEIEELIKSAEVESEVGFDDLDLMEPAEAAEPTDAEPTEAEPTEAEPTAAEPTEAEPTETEPTAAASPAAADDAGMVSLVDELGLDESGITPPPATAADTEAAADAYDETGMSWLDDVAAQPAAAEAQEESLFDEEDDFFDLAAELEAEMADDEGDLSIETPQEQSLQEIIDGFKKGVADNLSKEDYDTHFNLGIAYREMGLLDEAIGEFQLASKDPRHIVDCSSMLGMCFLEKGLPELAIRWYRKGLESPTVGEEQAVGLLYDMATAYLNLGDNEAAYRTFIEIYGMNSNYRDVAQRIQELSQEQTAS